MSALRIFSYTPNPRLWKATIAARIGGVVIDVRGAAPGELQDWLWDFDARPLLPDELAAPADALIGTVGFRGKPLHKTAAFLDAHPFGTVPAAFSPDGAVGIFESNSILRAVGRLAAAGLALYGRDPYEASRIDSFLDASLVFGRDTQPYLLALREAKFPVSCHQAASAAFATYLSGIERALANERSHLVGAGVTLADICFACELTMLWYEKPRLADLDARELVPVISKDFAHAYPRAAAHFERLRRHPAFAPDLQAHLAKLEGIS